MSSSLLRREFVQNGYYHVFNRGNARKRIFRKPEDYLVFFSLIEEYLSKKRPIKNRRWTRKNYYKQIEIVAFCLMPNHFHLMVHQLDKRSFSLFFQSICGAYTKYLNKKYDSVGHTFQDRFKARLIMSDADFINITKYIHRNPKNICDDILSYPYSSAKFYTQNIQVPDWLNTTRVEEAFYGIFGTSKKKFKRTYKKFLLDC